MSTFLQMNGLMPDTSMYGRMVFKGGGGQTQTTESGVPDWARPYLETAAKDAQALYKNRDLEKVADHSQDQLDAQQAIRDQVTGPQDPNVTTATGVLDQQAQGQGIFGTGAYGTVAEGLKDPIQRQVTDALGQQAGGFSRQGNLGGARAQAAATGTAANIASQLTSQELAAQRAGAAQGAQGLLGASGQQFGQQAAANQALAASGQAQQQQAQNKADAQYQGIQRLFGLINPGTVGQTQTSTSSGGGGK